MMCRNMLEWPGLCQCDLHPAFLLKHYSDGIEWWTLQVGCRTLLVKKALGSIRSEALAIYRTLFSQRFQTS